MRRGLERRVADVVGRGGGWCLCGGLTRAASAGHVSGSKALVGCVEFVVVLQDM